MALKLSEFGINKAVSVRLDDDTTAILCYFYHTADHKNNPTDKSQYRHELWITRIDDLQKLIEEYKKPENRLKDWHWPNPKWDSSWFVGYDKYNDQAKAAKFYQSKLNKMLDWEHFCKRVEHGIKLLGTGQERQYSNAQFAFTDYIDSTDNSIVKNIISSPTELLAHTGHVLYRQETLKRDLPKTLMTSPQSSGNTPTLKS